jgi:sugar phosphate isomerase/epimerase/glucose/arabinose dehydrogenase
MRRAVIAAAAGAMMVAPAALVAPTAFAAPADGGAATSVTSGAATHDGEDHGDPALDWTNYERTLITKDTGEPIALAILPDLKVLHTARNGDIRLTDSKTGVTKLINKVDVYANSEDGLQGIALDPDFEENQWVYFYYAPRVLDWSHKGEDASRYPTTTAAGSAPTVLPAGEDGATYWDRWLGYNQLSRAKWDAASQTIDMDTEQAIIKVEVQRGQCCHVGGDIDWDADGNLYLSTGDNTPAGAPGANGFAPNNNAPNVNPGMDDRRGAGNSNDLRGSILRITVQEDGSYTIPEGNLWAEGTELTRPEIFVTGLRNPFRMNVDKVTGAVAWGDYGPDAGNADPNRGPMGYVEWQSTTKPIFGGWPYCHGPNANYNEWDFATASPGAWFDCEAGAENNSTWNTGLDELPPATAPQLYYGDRPGDQPFDELVDFNARGGQGPMGGPIFRYDAENTNPGQFPEYWDGQAFFYEYSQHYTAAVEMFEGEDGQPDFDGPVKSLINFLPNEALETNGDLPWYGVIDMHFGPDGEMYVLDYGTGFFRQNPEAGLYRITYAADNKAPKAVGKATPNGAASAPLTVTLDATGSSDPEGGALTYAWDFDADGVVDSTDAVTTHTFTEVGSYNVPLVVTDPEGKSGAISVLVTVGNVAPELTLQYPAQGGFFSWGQSIPFKYTATDQEDGDAIACARLRWTFGIGHDVHAHPIEVRTNRCENVMATPLDGAEHGDTEYLFGVIVAEYTDAGAPGVGAARTELSTVLNTFDQQAEFAREISGATVVDDANAHATKAVQFGAGGYVAWTEDNLQPVNFTGIDGAKVNASGNGTVQLRWGSADAEPFATATVASAGLAEVAFKRTNGAVTLRFPEGTGSLYLTASEGVTVDQVFYNGVGVSQIPTVEEPVVIPAEQVSMQMFSLSNWTRAAGLVPVLERLSSIGFENIEPFGSTFSGRTAQEFRALTDSLGLNVPSSHYNTNEITFDTTLAFVKTVGQRYVGSGGFASPGINGGLQNVLATAATMNRLGERSVLNGTGKFFGHNHAGEFTTQYEYNGELTPAWEILVQNTDPRYVTFQVDVAWAAHAGVDVVALLDEYGDRIDLLHVKDAVNLGGPGNPQFRNLGEGDVPLQDILRKAQEIGVDLYVMEYDGSPANESFSAEGFEYLTGIPAGLPPVEIPAEQISIQMFSLIPWVRADGLPSVLEDLAIIGFENIEPYGSNFSGHTAQSFRDMTDQVGLNVLSSHYNVSEATFVNTLAFVKTLGQQWVGSGGFPSPGINGGLQNVLNTAQAMDRLGQRSVNNGTGKFFGHNHAGEFNTKYEYNGELTSAWEILVQNTDPRYVTFQVDVAWAAHAGVDVVALLDEYGDRIELLHVKDAVNLGGPGNPSFRNLGQGDMPLQDILRKAQEVGVKLYVMEYDQAANGRSFATEGFEYLTGDDAGTPAEESFIDVRWFDQFFTEIEWLASEGISTGWNTPAGKEFRPLLNVSRDAMAAFLYRLAGSPAYTAPATSPFVDVKTNNQFYKEISWLAAEGISTGWTHANGARSFQPGGTVNRDAMAAFLYRFAGEPAFTPPTTSPFNDVRTSNQFYKEITWLVDAGITTGWGNPDGTTSFKPVQPVTRDAMAAFMHRFDQAGL